MSTMLPPVLLELRAKATEAYKELGVFQSRVKMALAETAAAAEQAAAAAEAKASEATAKAEALSAKVARDTSARGARAAEEAAYAKVQAEEATAAAATARAEATAATAAVEAETARLGGGLMTLQRVGKAALVGLGVAVAVVGYEGVKMATEFQTSITLLQTGAGEAKSNLGTVSSGILHMAGQVGQSANELAKSMYVVESAGYHGADGLKVLQAAAEGARTDGADLAVVGDALTTVMKDMHAPASSSAAVMSQMVAAVGQGKMRMDDFAASIHNVLPNASALHIGFAQVAGALATMTAQGISAQQASQNLNHTIVKLAAPTAGMVKEMASYGISAQDVAQHLGQRGLTGTMSLLVNAITAHMGPAGLTLRNAFNQSKVAADDARIALEHLPPAAADVAKAYAAGKMSLGDWRAALKGLPADQAALLVQWKNMQDNAHGFANALKSGTPQAQTFTAAMKGMLGDQTGLQVALHLTGGAAGDFAHAVGVINGAVPEAGGHVRDWATVQHNFGLQMAQVKDGLQAYLIEIGTKLIPVLSAAITWGQKHTGILKIAAAVIGGVLLVAIAAYIVSMAAAAAETIAATWPILAIIAAIALVVYAIYELWTHWSQIWGWIKSHTLAFWQWMVAAFHTSLAAVKSAWTATWNAIKSVLSAAWGFVKTILGYLWEAMVPVRLQLAILEAAWKIGWAAIKLVARASWYEIQAIWNSLVGYLRGPFNAAVHWIEQVWSTNWNAIKSIARGAWSYISPILSSIKSHGLDLIRSGASALASGWSWTWGVVKSAVSGAWHYISPILSSISGAVSGALGAVDNIISAISSAGNAVSGFLNSLPGHAIGTPFFSGGLTWVGENGPELVALPRGSQIHSAAASRSLGGGGADEVVVHAHLYLDGREVYTSVQQHALRHNSRNTSNGLALPVGA